MSYAETREHLLDELDRVKVILSGAATLEDESVSTPEPTAETRPAEGTLPAPGELPLSLPDYDRERVVRRRQAIQERVDGTADDVTLRLRLLAERFSLTRRHCDVLLLALAPDLDPSFKQQYRVLYNDENATRPTVGLLADVFAWTDAQRHVATELVGSDSPLRRHGLVNLFEPEDPGGTALDREIKLTERIRSYLEGHDGLDPALDDVASLVPAERAVADLRLDGDVHDRVSTCTSGDDTPSRYYFYGPTGSQKRRAVEAIADDTVLRADLRDVVDAGSLAHARREARLLDCTLHLTGATDATTETAPAPEAAAAQAIPHQRETPSIDAIFESLADLGTDVFVTGTETWTPTETLSTGIDAIVEFPYPSLELRQAFWERHAHELPEGVDPGVLAGTFRLTQGELDAALSTARSLAEGDELTADDVYEGCSAQSAGGLSELAQRIEPNNNWSDIQLPEDTMRKLRIVRNHVKHQARIYSQWGYDEKFSRGTGVVSLFSGPSGTGKTMAAEVLADDVGMVLYKIDLSSVVSKYIGETEENLEEIFEAAENSNAILLFDEADAVFGDRAQVSDSTDRYANVEVNYLLQRIESYDGVVLLTTNYESNIDSAFSRRIDHTVSFTPPEQATRDAIWQGVFPDAAPLGDIDYDFLAEFEFTGGQIQTIGQTAAILAADDSERIEMEHVVQAIQLASEKEGQMLDSNAFGQYRDLLYTADDTADDGDETVDTHDEEDTTEPRESPESVVRAFFDHLDAGDGAAAHSRYHSSAIADQFSYQQLAKIRQDTLEIVSGFERIRDDSETVVLRFTQNLNGNRTQLDYELRLDDGEWRIFNFGRARSDDVVIES